MAGPLDGVKVIDFSRVLAGPHCTRVLVDMGADVVKVEPPDGDSLRSSKPRTNSLSPGFVHQNVGKRNISIDTKNPDGLALAKSLIETADVLVENFRPGVMAKLGLSYDEVSALNPKIVYASISGYGQNTTWAGRRAYAPLVHAEMGYIEATARYQQQPVRPEPMSHGDLYTGLHCAIGILGALVQRGVSGRGQQIDVCMAETMLFENELSGIKLSGMDEALPTANTGSQIFDTADGGRLMVAFDPAERGVFGQFMAAMGRPDLAEDDRFVDFDARTENLDALVEIIQAWVLTFDDVQALEAAMEAAGLSSGRVRGLAEVGQLPWVSERGAVLAVSDRGEGSFQIANSPWRFSAAETGLHGEIAYRGEHNAAVLSDWLDMKPDAISELEAKSVLSYRPPSHMLK